MPERFTERALEEHPFRGFASGRVAPENERALMGSQRAHAGNTAGLSDQFVPFDRQLPVAGWIAPLLPVHNYPLPVEQQQLSLERRRQQQPVIAALALEHELPLVWMTSRDPDRARRFRRYRNRVLGRSGRAGKACNEQRNHERRSNRGG